MTNHEYLEDPTSKITADASGLSSEDDNADHREFASKYHKVPPPSPLDIMSFVKKSDTEPHTESIVVFAFQL